MPLPAQAGDLVLDQIQADASALGQGRQAHHRGAQIAEVAAPARFGAARVGEVAFAGLAVEGHPLVVLARVAFEFEVQVRFDVLGALGQAGQAVGPQVQARQQVVAEAAFQHRRLQVAVGPGDQLEIAFDLLVAADRQEALFLQRAQQHRLFVLAELADLVEEQQALVGRAQQAGAIGRGAGVGALDVAEQGAHRAVAAQGRAVHFDEAPGQLMLLLFQFEYAPRQLALAGAGRAHQQDRRLRARGHGLDLLDHAVEGRIARGDAALEQVAVVQALVGEALGDAVVARQVQVDHRVRAGRLAVLLARRRGLQQPAREQPAFGQQEPADLADVGAGGDVDVVVLVLGRERIGVDEIMQHAVNAFEVPGIGQVAVVAADPGLRRDLGEVFADGPGQRAEAALVDQQLQAIEQEVLVHAQRDRRPPFFPAAGAGGGVELGAEHADHDLALHGYPDEYIPR